MCDKTDRHDITDMLLKVALNTYPNLTNDQKKKKRKSNMNSKFIINSYQLQAIVIDLFITPSGMRDHAPSLPFIIEPNILNV